MTSQNSITAKSLRRVAAGAVAAAALASGLVAGVSPAAWAQPSDSSDTPTQPTRVSPDQVLMMISQQYQTGSSGGQVSKLIEQVVTLRKQGLRPSNINTQALIAALDKRPNQGPLIAALQATLAQQRKQQMQAGNPVSVPAVLPPATPGSPLAPMGPSWAPGNPMQQDDDTIFPMPGR